MIHRFAPKGGETMRITWTVFHDEELIEKNEFNQFFWRGGQFNALLEGNRKLSIESNVNHGILLEDIAKALVESLYTDEPQTFHTYSTSKSYDIIFLGRLIEFRNFDPETLHTLKRTMLPKLAFIDAFTHALCTYLTELEARNGAISQNELFKRLAGQLQTLQQLTT